MPNWASLGGRCYVLGREVTSFCSCKRTSKSKSQWNCAGSETSRVFEQANVQKQTNVSDWKHQASSLIRSTQRATDVSPCMPAIFSIVRTLPLRTVAAILFNDTQDFRESLRSFVLFTLSLGTPSSQADRQFHAKRRTGSKSVSASQRKKGNVEHQA